MANPSLYVSNPVDVFKLNFTENLKIAEFCVKHKKRIVQFSTCEVYGITSARAFGKDSSKYPTPFVEDETPLIMGPVKNHRWIYACAKQLLNASFMPMASKRVSTTRSSGLSISSVRASITFPASRRAIRASSAIS